DRLLEAGHHDDAGLRLDLLDGEAAVDAVHDGHAHVHEGDVEVGDLRALQRVPAVRGDGDLVAEDLQQVGQAFGQVPVVVDDHDANGLCAHGRSPRLRAFCRQKVK